VTAPPRVTAPAGVDPTQTTQGATVAGSCAGATRHSGWGLCLDDASACGMVDLVRPELVHTLAAYDRHRDSFAGGGHHTAATQFCRKLDRGARILDLGCGAGWDLVVFEQAGLQAVGVDLSAGMLAAAAERTSALLVRADFTHLPFADGSVDAVWARAALVHCTRDEAEAAIREIRRVLDPRGAFELSLKGRTDGMPPAGYVDDVVGRRWFRFWDDDEFAQLVEPLKPARLECERDTRRSELRWLRAGRDPG